MEPWVANTIALVGVGAVVTAWALALLWRIGSWQLSQAEILTFDEGLPIGQRAQELACYASDGTERHLGFRDRTTFLVLGNVGCRPCVDLLEAAPSHPATRPMRRVYVTDTEPDDLRPEVRAAWEVYRYHAEESTRRTWRAPVSPYFHVVDPNGRVVEKGVASHSSHLDRLLHIAPPSVRRFAKPYPGAREPDSEEDRYDRA